MTVVEGRTVAAGGVPAPADDGRPPLDPYALRAEFPILQTTVHGKPLIYLDSASSSQKPARVIESMDRFYREYNANVHRGIYEIGERSTAAYEEARARVGRF
ncbi:MAG TPA: aminotransferase class V-fold PLP-dependent enzyme, partial [Candidatus Limnocylindrales bacterium]|nr:aminotransferase class V-fold PLP-dependent enzyme [Candidatus Limnocylindrales bacterium]